MFVRKRKVKEKDKGEKTCISLLLQLLFWVSVIKTFEQIDLYVDIQKCQ